MIKLQIHEEGDLPSMMACRLAVICETASTRIGRHVAEKRFADYWAEASNWITLTESDYYPDYLVNSNDLYTPVLCVFKKLLESSASSSELFKSICKVEQQWMRIQLCRVFRKYASPDTPVEMLKKKTKVNEICRDFGYRFRPINEVQAQFNSRPMPDEVICALLWEYKDRGQKGYDFTEKFFGIINSNYKKLTVEGPIRAGQDILLSNVLKGYPNPNRPVDFILREAKSNKLLAVGLARYDGDRGGAQEDDRTGGYKNCAQEIIDYSSANGIPIKVIFLNDGPGLLLGSMWRDYSTIDTAYGDDVRVMTLRMVPERLTYEWLGI